MEWIEAKTIVRNNPALNRNYLSAEYIMNIYHGCSHGCIYCFARSAYYKIEEFDRVRAKKDALKLIRNDLQRKIKTGIVMTGGISDPYNPEETKHRLTRNALELLNAYEFGACILTKSPLVARDTDILTDIKDHSPVNVSFSITCSSDSLSKQVEPFTAISSERFSAIEQLTTKGITTGVLIDPVLPYLTDTEENIKEMVRKSKGYGASYLYFCPQVTMEGIQRDYFYQEAEKISPGISDQYRSRYQEYYYCKSSKAKKLTAVFAEECEKLNIIYDMRAVNQLIRGGYSLSSITFRK